MRLEDMISVEDVTLFFKILFAGAKFVLVYAMIRIYDILEKSYKGE